MGRDVGERLVWSGVEGLGVVVGVGTGVGESLAVAGSREQRRRGQRSGLEAQPVTAVTGGSVGLQVGSEEVSEDVNGRDR